MERPPLAPQRGTGTSGGSGRQSFLNRRLSQLRNSFSNRSSNDDLHEHNTHAEMSSSLELSNASQHQESNDTTTGNSWPLPIPSLSRRISRLSSSNNNDNNNNNNSNPGVIANPEESLLSSNDNNNIINGSSRRLSLSRRLSSTMENLRRRTSLSQKTVAQVIAESSGAVNIVNVALPSSYSTRIFSWGRFEQGQALREANTSEENKSSEHSDHHPEFILCSNFILKHRPTSIAGGLSHSLLLTDNGQVYGGGDNSEGQIDPHSKEQLFLKPRLLEFLLEKQVAYVSCGLAHSAIVTVDGDVLTFGQNEYGQLGHSKGKRSFVGQRTLDGPIRREKAIQVACSEYSTFILTRNGEVFSCGSNARGILGIPSVQDPEIASKVGHSLAGVPIVHICAGSGHVLAISALGNVYGWGDARYGQLGVQSMERYFDAPISIQVKDNGQSQHSDQAIVHASCGEFHSAFISSKGKLYMCGRGRSGQLGSGKLSTDVRLPELVLFFQDKTVLDVSCGQTYSLVLVEGGDVYLCGTVTTPTEAVESSSIIKKDEEACVILLNTGSFEKERGVFMVFAAPQTMFALAIENGTSSSASILSSAIRKRGPTALTRISPSTLENLAKDALKSSMHESLMFGMRDMGVFSVPALNASFLTDGFSKFIDDKEQGLRQTEFLSRIDLEVFERTFDWISQAFSTIPRRGSILQRANISGKPKTEARDQNIKWLSIQFENFFNGQFTEFCKVVGDVQLYFNLLQPDQGRCFVLLLMNPLNSIMSDSCLIAFARAFTYVISSESKANSLAKWIRADISSDRFIKRMLRPFMLLVDKRVAQDNWSNQDTMHICRVLKFLSLVASPSEENPIRLAPVEKFYLEQPMRWGEFELLMAYGRWRYTMDPSVSPFSADLFSSLPSLFSFPFLISPAVKLRLMVIEQLYNIRDSAVISGELSPIFEVKVRRDCIIGDSFEVFTTATEQELRSHLQIKFDGEEGVDGGGVKKEFFQLISSQVFSPNFGMFIESHDTKKLWFNPVGYDLFLNRELNTEDDVKKSENAFRLVGTLFGLCIYNSTQIDVQFPNIFYRLLFKHKLNFDLNELAEVDPSLADGLTVLRDYDKDDLEEIFDLRFDVTAENFGSRTVYELMMNGSQIVVTQANKAQYIHLYCRYVLYERIRPFLMLMHEGLGSVMDKSGLVLSLFLPEELEVILVGTSALDFDALQRRTSYEGGYSETHPTIKQFWAIIKGFSEEEKKEFLRFVTGSPRAPVGGLGGDSMKFVVQRAGPDSDQLPTASTCYSTLLLPQYASKEKMEAKMKIMLANSSGFGLI